MSDLEHINLDNLKDGDVFLFKLPH